MPRPAEGWDPKDPANVSLLVVWLGSDGCDVTSRVFPMGLPQRVRRERAHASIYGTAPRRECLESLRLPPSSVYRLPRVPD